MDTKRLEVVQPIEWRRKWPVDVKARIVEEALAPGATIASVADRHGIARSQVYGWLKKARAGKLPGISLSQAARASFVPVEVEQPPAALSPAVAASARGPGIVEIALGNGRSLKVSEDIDPAVVARLAAALDGGKRRSRCRPGYAFIWPAVSRT
jgi:transposase